MYNHRNTEMAAVIASTVRPDMHNQTAGVTTAT